MSLVVLLLLLFGDICLLRMGLGVLLLLFGGICLCLLFLTCETSREEDSGVILDSLPGGQQQIMQQTARGVGSNRIPYMGAALLFQWL